MASVPDKGGIKRLQKGVGLLLYYARAVNSPEHDRFRASLRNRSDIRRGYATPTILCDLPQSHPTI